MKRAAARAANRWLCSCVARSVRCAVRDKRRVLSSTQRLDPLPDDPVIGNGTLTKYATLRMNYITSKITTLSTTRVCRFQGCRWPRMTAEITYCSGAMLSTTLARTATPLAGPRVHPPEPHTALRAASRPILWFNGGGASASHASRPHPPHRRLAASRRARGLCGPRASGVHLWGVSSPSGVRPAPTVESQIASSTVRACAGASAAARLSAARL